MRFLMKINLDFRPKIIKILVKITSKRHTKFNFDFLFVFNDFSSQVKKADFLDHPIFIMDFHDVHDATNVRNHENNQKTNLEIDTNSGSILDSIFNENQPRF